MVHSSLKTSVLKPLFKSGARDTFTNWRPISILSAAAKLFEKCVCNQLCAHFERNNIFFKHQYGFRAGHSTIHAILTFCDVVQTALDTNNYNISVFIDLKKAFNTIDFGILLKKLEHYGVKGIANDWFRSYLNGRVQYTEINGIRSHACSVRVGVPQGSVAGPLLFLILINDFNLAVDTDTVLFADDTTMQVSGPELVPLFARMNKNLARAASWFDANLLTLNASKTKYILFSSKNQHCHEIDLEINNSVIERIGSDCETKTFKFLGINVDDSLSWSEHINKTKRKLYSGCFGLSNSKHFVPFKARKCIYNSLIVSHLNYGNLATACAKVSDVNYLVNVQKRAIRHVYLAKRNAHTAPLFYDSKYLNFFDSVAMSRALFIHRYINDRLPEAFSGKFEFKQKIGNDRVRADDGKLFVPNFNYPKARYPIWECVKHWNTLLHWLRQITKESKFRIEYREILLEK